MFGRKYRGPTGVGSGKYRNREHRCRWVNTTMRRTALTRLRCFLAESPARQVKISVNRYLNYARVFRHEPPPYYVSQESIAGDSKT